MQGPLFVWKDVLIGIPFISQTCDNHDNKGPTKMCQPHYTDSEPGQSVDQLISVEHHSHKHKPPVFKVFGVMQSGAEPRPPVPRADVLTTRLQGRTPYSGATGMYYMYMSTHEYYLMLHYGHDQLFTCTYILVLEVHDAGTYQLVVSPRCWTPE